LFWFYCTIWIALALAVIYLAICAFYYVFQERFIFVPLGTLNEDAVIELATPFKEVFLEGEEGGKIHAIHLKSKDPRGCILYFHGNTGHISRWGPIAEELTSFGFDVFVPDYRGYGKSRGKRTEDTLFSDARLCYEEILRQYPPERICIYGRSLGSAMTCMLGANTKPGGIILETPFDNLASVAGYHTKIIPVKWFLRFSFRNDENLPKAVSPILIAHGTKDIIVPYRHGFSLFKSTSGKAEMVTIPGGHHGDLNGYPLFREKLEEFFNAHFPVNP